MTINEDEILIKDRDGVRIPQWYDSIIQSFIEVSDQYPLPIDLVSNSLDIQDPLPTNCSTVFATDIKSSLSDIGTFETFTEEDEAPRAALDSDIDSLFNNIDNYIQDASSTNPKWFEFFLERPVNNGAFNINTPEGDFSNVKIILKNRQDTSIKTLNDSTNNSKYENHPYPFTTKNYCCVRVEFHTVDPVTIGGIFIQKNQSVVIDSIDGFESHVNSSLISLGSNEKFQGESEDSKDYGSIQVALYSETEGVFLIEARACASSIWRAVDTYTVLAGEDKAWSFQGVRRHVRVSFQNSSDAQGEDGFDLQTIFKPVYIKPSSHPLGDIVKINDDAELVKSQIVGLSELTGLFDNIATFRDALKVDTALVHKAGVNALFTQESATTTTLTAQANSGDIDVDVVSAASFSIGDQVFLNSELFHFHITDITANNVQLDHPLDNTLPIGTLMTKITNNMAVVGSLASPQSFKVKPPVDPPEIWQLTRIIPVMIDGTPMDDGKFGGIPALTNGAVLRAYRNGISRTGAIWKTNGDMALDMYNLDYTDKAPAGEYGMRGRWTFTNAEFIVELDGATGDYAEILIQDDNSANTGYYIKAQGRIFGA